MTEGLRASVIKRLKLRQILATQSFKKPIVHFGLDQHQPIDYVIIRGSTDEVTWIIGPIKAGHNHRIERLGKATEID